MKLFWKLFGMLGLVVTLAMVAAVSLGFYIGQQNFEQWLEFDFPEREPAITGASRALATGGREGLTEWLRDNTEPAPGRTLYITQWDPNLGFQDLLGRDVPWTGQIFIDPRGFGGQGTGDDRGFGNRRGGPRGSNDGRNAEWTAPQNRTLFQPETIQGPNGDTYFPLFRQTDITLLDMLSLPTTRFGVVTLAIAMAALTALLLAKSLSSPIVRLQRATRALAAGMLETRVGAPFNRRKDEVGTLARDFDTMAEQIQALITDKEILLRDVSHELRSPLARMQVALALAQRKVPEETQGDLERIGMEAEKLDQLVGQILTLARLRSSPLEQYSDVDLKDVVTEVVEDARYEHPNVTLTFNADDAPPIEGNATELASAIENVVRNALLHAGVDAEVAVALKLTPNHVLVSIADNGPGVPEETLGHLFEPFYRADPSRDHKQSGYGLGLAIASSIIERHGGSVEARNRPGGGLEVSFSLTALSISV